MYVDLYDTKVSPDHKILAYALNAVGGDAGYFFFKNLETGEMYSEEIENVAGFVWCGNSKTFYYQIENHKTKKANNIYRHTLGHSLEKDTLIYREESKTINAGLSKTGEYILLDRGSFNETEQLYLHEDNPYGFFTRFEPIQKGVYYNIIHNKQEDFFYISTNWNAPDGRFMRSKITPTAKQEWEDVVPSRKAVAQNGVIVKKNHFIVSERKSGENYFRVINRKSHDEYIVKPEMDVYSMMVSRKFDYDTTYFRYSYSSLLNPPKQCTHYLNTHSDSVYIDTLEQKYDINQEDYITKRLWATTKDSVKVPMDIIYKKELERNGTAPVYLYAYASYGMNMYPSFNHHIKSIVDRGFIYVLAHPRGESFLGKQWHEKAGQSPLRFL